MNVGLDVSGVKGVSQMALPSRCTELISEVCWTDIIGSLSLRARFLANATT